MPCGVQIFFGMWQEMSESSKIAQIKRFLAAYADGFYRDSLVEFSPDSGEYLVFILGDIGRVTDRAKSMMARRLQKAVSSPVAVAQFSDSHEKVVEQALFELLELFFKQRLIDVLVTSPSSGEVEVIVFLEKGELLGSDYEEVEKKSSEFLKQYEKTIAKLIVSEVSTSLPTAFQIMRKVFIMAPVSLSQLADELARSEYLLPSKKWLNRQLDTLLRKHLVTWDTGKYILTLAGISMIPAARNRQSADIERTLAFARRKW